MEKDCQLFSFKICTILSVVAVLVCPYYASEAMTLATTTIPTERQSFQATVESEIELKCFFQYQGPTYICRLRNLNLTTDVVVTTVSGTHVKGKTNADVRGVHFKSGSMFFLPSGLEKFFPNLNYLIAGDGYEDPISFRNIKRSSLSKLDKLTVLSIYSDVITEVDDDALWDLPILKDFLLSGNGSLTLHENTFQKNTFLHEVVFMGMHINSIPKNIFENNSFLDAVYFQDCYLTAVDESLFEKNTKLTLASFNSNRLEHLPANLLKNNLLLEVIDFAENLLKNIEIDFTIFKFIDSIDLEDNVCIDAYYETDGHRFDDSYTNLTELQSVIKAKCSKSELSANIIRTGS